jgi:hypothetical protein
MGHLLDLWNAMSYMEVIFLLLINVGGKRPVLSRFSMGTGGLE